MKIKHTPGPWEARGKIISSGIDCVGGECIAECYDNWVANAALIAAAPELLDACKRALIMCSAVKSNLPLSKNSPILAIENELIQAITKAEGKND